MCAIIVHIRSSRTTVQAPFTSRSRVRVHGLNAYVFAVVLVIVSVIGSLGRYDCRSVRSVTGEGCVESARPSALDELSAFASRVAGPRAQAHRSMAAATMNVVRMSRMPFNFRSPQPASSVPVPS
jgi:hypothetical protein